MLILFLSFEVIINTIFPDTRAMGVIKKLKVLRPTLEEQKIQCSINAETIVPRKI